MEVLLPTSILPKQGEAGLSSCVLEASLFRGLKPWATALWGRLLSFLASLSCRWRLLVCTHWTLIKCPVRTTGFCWRFIIPKALKR